MSYAIAITCVPGNSYVICIKTLNCAEVPFIPYAIAYSKSPRTFYESPRTFSVVLRT
ncbi:hypothetical protein [Aliterella atlantica]|uniref:hypothetical protein n=1 Tax=Aliterella atlantica TaxID=1827278 RepID=UPI001364A90C